MGRGVGSVVDETIKNKGSIYENKDDRFQLLYHPHPTSPVKGEESGGMVILFF